MNYNHFNMDERIVIAQLKKSGYSIREISRILDRAPSSISREIKRNTHLSGHHYKIKHYNPVTAQNKYESRKKKCGRKSINSSEIIEYIKEKIELHWSPEQISNYPSNIKAPSTATIYRIIHSNKIKNVSIFKVVNKLIVSLKLLTLFLCQEQVRQEIYFCLFVFGPFCMLEL